MKTILKFLSRYRYFIVGALAVSLAYGLVQVFREVVARREPELPEVQRINYDRAVLQNGLELIVHQDSSAPAVSIHMSYRVGSRDEPRDKTGLAHLTEHLLLEAGGRRDSQSESVIDRLGAWDFNGSTNRDRTGLYMTIPKQSLDAALWIESERMGYLSDTLTDAALHSARQDVLNELRRNESAPGAVLEAAITDAAFPPDHPYSHLPGGDPKNLEAISLADVKQWISGHYKPNNATLVVAGDVDLEMVRSHVEKYFGPIPGAPRTQELVSRIPQQLSLRRFLTTSVPAGTLVFIWSLPGQGSPDLDHLDLARHLLEIRLVQRLVNQDRTASSVQIDFNPYHLCSLLVLKVEMNARGTESNITSSVEQELAELTSKDLESAELSEVKRAILTSLLFTSERVGGPLGKAEILASAATLTGNAADFNLTLERVRNASPNDVRVAAGAWLSLKVATLLAHGPKAEQPTSVSGLSRPPTMPLPYRDEVESQLRVLPEPMRLPNGLTILAVKRPGPVGAVKLLWRKDPSLTILQEQLTKATLNLLSDSAGSARKSELQHDLARLSARFVLDDTSNYYALGLELPSQYFAGSLEVLSKMMVGASFEESEVAAVRGQWERRLKRTEPSSWKVYLSTLLRLISTDKFHEATRMDCSPFRSFTAAEIQQTYATKFRPDDAILIVVGDIDPPSVQEQASLRFGAWRSAGERQSGVDSFSKSRVEKTTYIIDRHGTDYAMSLSGLASPDSTSDSLSDILASILDSRASRSLREETQMAREVFAGRSGWHKSDLMYVYADARIEQVPQMLRLVEHVFRAPDNGEVFCEGELKRARNLSAKRTLQALGSTRSLMDLLTALALDNERDSQAVSITCENLLNLNRRISENRDLIQLVVGDSKRLPRGSAEQKVELIERPCWSSLY